MASYIGKVQIGEDIRNQVLIGSTLYGICATPASTPTKDITPTTYDSGNRIEENYVNTSYDQLLRGTTIHIKFIYGNTLTSGVSLLVGSLDMAQNVVGNFVCPPNSIISFTLDEEQHWIPNDNVITEYEFMTAYDAQNNKIATAADLAALNIQEAAHRGVVTDVTANSTSTDLPTTKAVYDFVQDQTGGLSGLTGAMHFRGTTSTIPLATATLTYNTYISGDVLLGPNNKEYVYIKGDSAENSSWVELGDEGSYALKTSTAVVVGVVTSNFVPNTLPTLSVTDTTVSSVTVSPGFAASLSTTSHTVSYVSQAGRATTASVASGILNITLGQDTVVSNPISITGVQQFTPNTPTIVTSTPITIGSASGWSQGTAASYNLVTTSTIVVVPDNAAP